MKVDFALNDCQFENNDVKSEKPVADALLAFNGIVLAISLISLLSCFGWFCRGHKLRKVSGFCQKKIREFNTSIRYQ